MAGNGTSARRASSPRGATSGGRLRLAFGGSLRAAVLGAMREMVGYAGRMVRQAHSRPGFAVHEWRKSMRRCRALLRLCAPLIDRAEGQRIAAAFRNAQRAASSLRDAEVLLPVLGELVADAHTRPRQRVVLIRMKRGLMADRRRQRSPGQVAHAALAGHLAKVQAARERFERALPVAVTFEDLEGGLSKSYRRAVRAFARTRKDQDDDVAFHDLRKAVKVLHYQAELLSVAGDRRVEKLRKNLSQLAEVQGRVTDLLVLRAEVAGGGNGAGAKGAGAAKQADHALDELLSEGIVRRRRPAERAARKLLSRPPRRFARRVVKSAEKALGSH